MPQSLSPWYREDRHDWEREVLAWLGAVGRSRSLGGIEALTTVKERPWSLVWQVIYETGTCYFKACGAAGKHEPALLSFLKKQSDLSVPAIHAIELQRCWILMADAGVPLREAYSGIDEVRIFGALLGPYARIQMASRAWVERLLDMGLPDRRLQRLPQLLSALIEDDIHSAGQDPETWRALRDAVRGRLPLLEQVCAELDQAPYAAALDHSDVHQTNVLVRDGMARLSDWGDACVTHPFCSLLVTLETALSQIAQADRDHWANYLRDAYLEPWESLQPPEALRRDLQRALWAAHVVRALNFAHMFQGAEDALLKQWRPMIAERLAQWVALDAPP